MKEVLLEEVCEAKSSNIAIKDLDNNNGEYPIYGASGFIKNVDFYKFDKPYIAIVKDGAGVGRVMLLPAKSSIIGTMQAIIPNETIDINYLYNVLVSKKLSKYYTGATIPHIYFKDYKNEKINIYSIEKQKNISIKLTNVSNLIRIKTDEINKLDELIKSQFVELFDNCNTIDLIGNLVSINRGASPRPINDYITNDVNGVNWIKIGDVSENSLYITDTKEKITEKGAEKSRRVYKGDFILSNSMSFGRPYILKIDGCVHDGWLVISNFKNHFDEMYLYYALRSDYVQKQFNNKVNGATVKNLNSDLVKETYIKIPNIELQNKFSTFARLIDKQKFEFEKQLKKLEELQASLMQEYFG